jgi:hypothetical protein
VSKNHGEKLTNAMHMYFWDNIANGLVMEPGGDGSTVDAERNKT